MTGWLTKRGHYMPTWHRRWIVIEAPSTLHYFTAPDGAFKGTVDLAGAEVTPDQDKPLELFIKTWNDDEKDFLLRAGSEEKR